MKTLSRFLLLLLLLGTAFNVSSQDKPRWAQKGVASLNKERTNDTYEFVKFETFGGDLERLRKERLDTLIRYFADHYSLNEDAATVTTISGEDAFQSMPNDADGDSRVQRTYLVTFAGNRPAKFYAELVDEYVTFDENVDMSYDYTLYQLYAVSSNAGGNEPAFDDFTLTRTYNAKALALSIIPGLGQFYKGQDTKGYCFLGGDVVFAATAVICDMKRRDHLQNARDHQDVAPSYRSKAKSWRTMRNLAIGCAAATYVYNLFDAALSKGARRVVVSRPDGANIALAPAIVYDPVTEFSPALSLSVTF